MNAKVEVLELRKLEKNKAAGTAQISPDNSIDSRVSEAKPPSPPFTPHLGSAVISRPSLAVDESEATSDPLTTRSSSRIRAGLLDEG